MKHDEYPEDGTCDLCDSRCGNAYLTFIGEVCEPCVDKALLNKAARDLAEAVPWATLRGGTWQCHLCRLTWDKDADDEHKSTCLWLAYRAAREAAQ